MVAGPGLGRPLGVTYDLSMRWAADARALAQATNAQFLLGINLEADRTRISQAEADRLVTGIGRRYIAALEIGNEPDLYTVVPWSARATAAIRCRGTPTPARPCSHGRPRMPPGTT